MKPPFEKPGLMLDPKSGYEIGKDPDAMSATELAEASHVPGPLLKTIRQYCLTRCAGRAGEVRKCPVTMCPLWPHRMGTQPKAWRRTDIGFAKTDPPDSAK
jgi:hypothetical protein